MNTAVILSAVRTPTGKFLGSLKDFTAPQLGALAVREAVARAGIDPQIVDECIMGNVIQAGNGQNPARQAALNGGLPETVSALTINKVCGSGLKAVMLAAQGIAVGDIEIAVAGGMESMSNTPYLLPRVREGLRMGNGQLIDSMINDGLWCSFENCHMGMAGEHVAETYKVGRAEQDAYAVESHRKAAHAGREGWFKDEILPITIPQRKGNPIVVDRDEAVREDTSVETLGALKAAFKKDGGTVTAGNAPGVNDGASAVVVMSESKARGLGLDADGAHRRAGDDRTGAEAGVDDAGAVGPQGCGKGGLGSEGRRPDRDQRSVLGAGRRRRPRTGHRHGPRQRPRRRRGARPSDWRERLTRADHAAVCDAPPRCEARHRRPVPRRRQRRRAGD